MGLPGRDLSNTHPLQGLLSFGFHDRIVECLLHTSCADSLCVRILPFPSLAVFVLTRRPSQQYRLEVLPPLHHPDSDRRLCRALYFP